MTWNHEDRVVIGPNEGDESTNEKWILTTSGFVVAQRDVSARMGVIRGEKGKPEVKLTRGGNTAGDEKIKEKEGFIFHVMLEKNEVKVSGVLNFVFLFRSLHL